MKQSFELEFEFMEKWGRFAKPEYLQIFLYTYMLYRKNNSVVYDIKGILPVNMTDGRL